MTLLDTITQVQTETRALNSSFSAALPTLQLAWDSTSLGALKKCPRFYQYSIIEGRSLGLSNAHLKFGIVFHSATELYARLRAEALGHDSALLLALKHAIIETWDFALSRPWVSEEPTKTRDTLFRSIIWYLDQFQNDRLKTIILANGDPAVEQSFRFDSGLTTASAYETCQACNGTGYDPGTNCTCASCLGDLVVPSHYLLCGHIDRIVEWNGEVWITDKKTTKYDLDDNYFKQYTPDNQISLYAIAGIITLNKEIDGLIIDGCQILVTGSRFRRRPIPRSTEVLEAWLKDLQFYLREAEVYARENYWPQRETSCGYGRNQCQFRPVCSAEPVIRETLLDSMYQKRVWDPLKPR